MNINFPPLTFTAPGIYAYTVKELTPSDVSWQTDSREYRAIVTVTQNENGALEAHVDYPDGFPKFVNRHVCPPPPCNICKYFDRLPFPSLLFAPPQKPEFMRMMQSSPNEWQQWENTFKYMRTYCK
ncbi:MAG: hypothetical protein FWC71_09195 [Defluviitaleaceae bacterium]|nr:hypothetical protein [Defluviitaleaceae bacterium]